MIWLVPLALLAAGIFLSAFFSGSETGFYRISRIRLAMDARAGDRLSTWLFWLVNRPVWFVATTLVGNKDAANNLSTLAIVLAVRQLFPGSGHHAELMGTLLVAPVVFVYGELIPKSLYYETPNRLLRRSTPLLIACTFLFAPISLVLAGLSALLRRLAGEPLETLETVFARQHLEQVLHEGHEEGLLLAGQQRMVRGVLDTATRSVTAAMVPIQHVVGIPDTADTQEALRLAARHRTADVLVRRTDGRGEWVAYVNVAELTLGQLGLKQAMRPLVDVPAGQSHLQALLTLQRATARLGIVVDGTGKQLGLITQAGLSEALLRVPTR